MLLSVTEQIINTCFALLPYRKPQSTDTKKAQLIAHRGAHCNARGIIENTLKAFQLAREAGCWGLELDIHATADKVLIVNHDATLTRLWGHNVAIADLSYKELQTLVPEIPSLKDVIDKYKKEMHLFIELKAPFEEEQALVSCLQDLTPCKDFHLLTLNPSVFAQLSQVPKSALVLVAVHNNVRQFCELSIKEQYGGVTGNYLLLTDKKLQKLREAQQEYGVGFVNSRHSLHRELNRGIRWLFTNEAVAMAHYLKQLNQI